MAESFIALYRGPTVGSARLVAVSSDSDLVRRFAEELLSENGQGGGDPVTAEIEAGRRRALEIVRDEAGEQDGGR